MELILDVLFDLIFEGSVSAVGDKKVSLVIRILAGLFLFVVFGGIIGICLFIGITESNWFILAAGVIVAVARGVVILRSVRRRRRRV